MDGSGSCPVSAESFRDFGKWVWSNHDQVVAGPASKQANG